MKGKVIVTFVDQEKVKFGDDPKAIEYRKVSFVDDEGFPGQVYVKASEIVKFGETISVSVQPKKNKNGGTYLGFKAIE